MRLIKKYKNRKLYDTQTSRYINLKSLLNLVDSGVDLSIIDSTGNNITKKTLLLAVSIQHSNFTLEDVISFIVAKRNYATNTIRKD
jgi:polyhydroxyalkanoate synthesis regulator protein